MCVLCVASCIVFVQPFFHFQSLCVPMAKVGSSAEDVVQLVECLPTCTRPWLSSPALYKRSMVVVQVRVCITVSKNYDKKLNWGRKDLFGLYFHIAVHHQIRGQELKQGRNLAERADAKAMKECCLLACSSRLDQSASL